MIAAPPSPVHRPPSTAARASRRAARAAAALALALVGAGVAGCGMVARSRSLFGGNLPVIVTVSPEVNQNSPVAVEFVVVYKKPLLEKLLAMPASDWFARREQLLRDFPDDVEAWAWEWVPGQDVGRLELDFRVGAKGGVIFADYFAPGDHRATFEPHAAIRVSLEDNGFTVGPQGRGDWR